MAIIQSGANSTSLLTVDPTMTAARVTMRPSEILGAYELGLVSGSMTTIAAGATVYAFRWAPATATNLCLIRRVEIGFSTITAFGAAQSLQYSMQVARQWTASDTGGRSEPNFTQTNTAKMRTAMPTSAFAGGGQIMIANAAAMTAGTRTLDTQPMAFTNGTSTTVGTSMPNTAIFQQQTGDYPLIFANNEGFIINNVQLMGATGVINMYVNVEWFELAATTGNAIAY
jgi:hypothetical protein